MTKPKIARIPLPKKVSAEDLIQLNSAAADRALSQERFEHHITKGHLLRSMLDVARLQNEVNTLKAERSAVTSSEQQQRGEKEALNDKQAKEKLLFELAADIRDRYSVPEKFEIDPMSGEFINLEA